VIINEVKSKEKISYSFFELDFSISLIAMILTATEVRNNLGLAKALFTLSDLSTLSGYLFFRISYYDSCLLFNAIAILQLD